MTAMLESSPHVDQFVRKVLGVRNSVDTNQRRLNIETLCAEISKQVDTVLTNAERITLLRATRGQVILSPTERGWDEQEATKAKKIEREEPEKQEEAVGNLMPASFLKMLNKLGIKL